MKRYLILVLAAFAVAIAAPSAFATHVIFDPTPSPAIPGSPPTGTDCTTDNSPCEVYLLDTKYLVSFVDCSTIDSTAVTSAEAAYPGFTATSCLWLNNLSGQPLNKFTFEVANSDFDQEGESLVCGSSPITLASSSGCPSTVPSVGDYFSVSFVINTAPIYTTYDVSECSECSDYYYLLTDFVNLPDPAGVTVSVAVPEPGELGLFGLGLLAIGVGYGLQKRRQNRQANQAA